MQNSNNKIRVGIFYGGCSPEFQVSISSALSIINHLDKLYFEVVLIYVSPTGEWFITTTKNEPSKIDLLAIEPNKRINYFPLFYSDQRLFDVAFPLIHGATGEDGMLQGLLEFSGYPYVGSRVLASAICMNKYMAKSFIQLQNISVATHILVKKDQWSLDKFHMISLVVHKLHYPVVIKPADAGSSIGVHWVENNKDLEEAIDDAFNFSNNVIIEEAIDVREIYVGILEQSASGKTNLIVSEAGEVIFTGNILSKKIKEKASQLTNIDAPAKITLDQSNQAKDLAIRIFNLLQCEGMARIDLFLDNKSGDFKFNEVNTLPGFTLTSIYPKIFSNSGIPIHKLLTNLIEFALFRQKRGLMQ